MLDQGVGPEAKILISESVGRISVIRCDIRVVVVGYGQVLDRLNKFVYMIFELVGGVPESFSARGVPGVAKPHVELRSRNMRDDPERARIAAAGRVLNDISSGPVRPVIESLHHHRGVDLVDISRRFALHFPAAVQRVQAYSGSHLLSIQVQIVADRKPVIAAVITFVRVFIDLLVSVYQTDLV